MKENDVRICEKYALTVTEAAAYFGIGEKKLRNMIEDYNHLAIMYNKNNYDRMLDKKTTWCYTWHNFKTKKALTRNSRYSGSGREKMVGANLH